MRPKIIKIQENSLNENNTQLSQSIEPRKSAVFYKSFYDAIRELDREAQLDTWTAIFEYAFYSNEIQTAGATKLAFRLIKPQLDANIAKYENGKKGGRPKIKKPSDNLNETEYKPDVNLGKTKDIPIKSKGKGNVNVNENVSLNLNKDADVDENKKLDLITAGGLIFYDPRTKKAFMDKHRFKDENSLGRSCKKFIEHLEARNIHTKSIKDFRDHFGNWIESGKKKRLN